MSAHGSLMPGAHTCLAHIVIGSPDFLTLKSIIMDVFQKYAVKFIRENLLAASRPLTPPPEFPDSSRSVMRYSLINEGMIRQQSALYDAAVENTRKSKDLPAHILRRIEAAARQSSEHLHYQTEEATEPTSWPLTLGRGGTSRMVSQTSNPMSLSARIPAEPANIQETQENFSGANETICKVI
ncbi:hypothetical protein PtA15_8A416 [Puccinia triticina]|uniref:Uncharacterized protein n=1 Tax=Puccinia triticina TaxID=208348 RepID=A0ABY7CU59_9BASI|nr:uncharacterized protein PtA15_8A416 [Puccinia triticina]WAQ87512.1 hypothetical protein PtA15_8A416 [Puccinia triticina]